MRKQFISGVALCMSSILFQNCQHKGPETLSSTPAYDFSYSGQLIIHNNVSFMSNAPSSSTFLWNFGDGATSTLANPVHAYNAVLSNSSFYILSYPVTLIVNGDAAQPITKYLRITPGTAQLSGNWHWTGGRYQYFNPVGAATVADYPLNDTVFSITTMSDTSLEVWGEIIPYVGSTGQYFNGYNELNGNKITYTNDTIFFLHTFGSLGAVQYTSYHYP